MKISALIAATLAGWLIAAAPAGAQTMLVTEAEMLASQAAGDLLTPRSATVLGAPRIELVTPDVKAPVSTPTRILLRFFGSAPAQPRPGRFGAAPGGRKRTGPACGCLLARSCVWLLGWCVRPFASKRARLAALHCPAPAHVGLGGAPGACKYGARRARERVSGAERRRGGVCARVCVCVCVCVWRRKELTTRRCAACSTRRSASAACRSQGCGASASASSGS